MTAWKPVPVPGYGHAYQVSDNGQVRSVARKHTSGRVLRVGSNSRGYSIAVLCIDGVRAGRSVHRLVAEAFIGPAPEGMQVCHRDGDKTNNAVGNLYYGTPSQNELDKIRHGANPNSNKTHCPQGHAYTVENTTWSSCPGRRPNRRCRTCARDRKRMKDASRRVLELAS